MLHLVTYQNVFALPMMEPSNQTFDTFTINQEKNNEHSNRRTDQTTS